MKLIPTILPDYIPPLASAVSHDSVPRDFDYTMFTVYLPNGIHEIKTQHDNIVTLKFIDFNLGDHKNHSMLSPYKYLTRKKGLENNPLAMDYESHAIHPLECNEDSTLWKAPGG
jgi:hypothetical protein